MRARPGGPVHRSAGAGRRHQGLDVAAAFSRAVQGDESRPRACDRHRRLPRRQQRPRFHRQGRTHLRRTNRNPVGSARSEIVRARRRLRRAQAGRHRRRSRRRLAGTDRRARQPRPQRRDAAARKPGAAGSVAQVAEARRTHRQGRAFRRRPAQGRPRPRLLRGRWNMARAGAHPHHPERIPAGGDARLFHTGPGRAWFRAAPAPSGIGEHAGQYRGCRRCAAAVARLCRAGSGIHHPRRKAENHRIFDLRGARGPALRKTAGQPSAPGTDLSAPRRS